MFATLVLVSLFALQTAALTSVTLPDTPQGRQVDAYIKAFNTGDEKVFLAANEKTMTPELLAKRPAEERAKLFQRLRGDFATIKIARMVKATPGADCLRRAVDRMATRARSRTISRRRRRSESRAWRSTSRPENATELDVAV